MKRRTGMLIQTVIVCVLLTGCSGKNIEAQAYAVSMGIDLREDQKVEVCIQVPALNQGGDAESASGEGGKGYIFKKASGNTLTGALELMNASIPRELNLTGVKSVVVSEELARSRMFPDVLEELALAYRVYGAAELIVCEGAADQFIRNHKPVIGLRLSESTAAALHHYRETGYIPSAKAADIFYLSHSLYGDPVAVLAADGQEESDHPGQAQYAGSLDVSGDGPGQYYGAALLKEGVMAGRLTGMQTQLLNMLLGDLTEFSWVVDGVPVRIVVKRTPDVRVNLHGRKPDISVSVPVGMMDSEGTLQPGRLEEVMEERLIEMTRLCQELEVDPFRFAEAAVRQFLTVDEWLEYDWRSAFSEADIRFEVRASRSEL